MVSPLYIAVDLGAGSGRVFIAGVDPDELLLEEIHRFQYPPVEKNGHLRWDFVRILTEINTGLRKAGQRSREVDRPIRSIGVDTWAVDYGLVDAGGDLIADPICYRDDRTLGVMERGFSIVPREKIFEKTGIQFQNFNTIYQLCTESENLKNASSLYLLPDLINYFLTGRSVCEYTNATTTQLVNAVTRNWDVELQKDLGLPTTLFRCIVEAGEDLGELKPEIQAETGVGNIRVIAPATHDTASAVAGAPIGRGEAYISSGTWSLIGVELNNAVINADVSRQNFTNEGGAYGTVRFLKNVMGLWIFESCRREWSGNGIAADYDQLLSGVEAVKGFKAFIFPDDKRFLNPPNMLEALASQISDSGQTFDSDPVSVSKIIFDSLAFRYASVLRSVESLTRDKLERIQILGGGGKNSYLSQMTANASGLPVRAGLTEATVLGNVLVQAITAGRFNSLAEARQHVADNIVLREFTPHRSAELTDAARRYAEIEARFNRYG